MKKRFSLVLLVVLGLFVLLAQPVLGAGLDIREVIYDFDAAESEPALTLVWSGKNPIEVRANEFQLKKRETTILEVEARIEEEFLAEHFDTLEKLTTIDPEDEVRQVPPVLTPDEEIIIINNNEYLLTHGVYFDLHIYSLDDPDTPESELSFITKFSKFPIPGGWW